MDAMEPGRLLLFDIDGTLLDTGGAGLRALRGAFLDFFGIGPDRHGEFPVLDLAGSTDGGILRGLFDHFGWAWCEDRAGGFYELYHERLAVELSPGTGTAAGRVLPGVPELLDRLKNGGGHRLGLLTGNTERGAWTKVEAYGLAGYFGFGAFGDDHHDRDRLGPIALARAARETGRAFAAAETVIVGDTPKDIRCARACGARVVAVGTGRYSAAQLSDWEPDCVFEDLTDAAAFEAAIREW